MGVSLLPISQAGQMAYVKRGEKIQMLLCKGQQTAALGPNPADHLLYNYSFTGTQASSILSALCVAAFVLQGQR